MNINILNVPAHVGVIVNGRADRLLKAVARRTQRNALMTSEECMNSNLESMLLLVCLILNILTLFFCYVG